MTTLTQEKSRLESWKEIAVYLRRSERTAMRWETERGLPVRRVSGLDKSRVYAEIAELDAWRLGNPTPAASSELESAPPSTAPRPETPRRHISRGALAVAAAAVLSLALTAAVVLTISISLKRVTTALPPLAAQRLYLTGMDDWARRTPEGLNRAVAEFRAAIARDPDYGDAYAGLAISYDLLREYTLMPSNQAYQLATAAAQKALSLDDRLSYAHAALGFAQFYGSWKTASARREFSRAVELDPRNETAHHWRATFLSALGDNIAALREIDAARALNPGSSAIAADRAFIMGAAGRRADAIVVLRTLEESNPAFLSPHNYLAGLYFDAEDDVDYLRESEVAAKLEHDRVRQGLVAAATEGFTVGGHAGMLADLMKEETDEYLSGATSAYTVARTWAFMGNRQKAMDYLRLAVDRTDTDAIGIAGDPAFARWRGDPQFQRIADRVFNS